jgi:hypothetical protein
VVVIPTDEAMRQKVTIYAWPVAQNEALEHIYAPRIKGCTVEHSDRLFPTDRRCEIGPADDLPTSRWPP